MNREMREVAALVATLFPTYRTISAGGEEDIPNPY